MCVLCYLAGAAAAGAAATAARRNEQPVHVRGHGFDDGGHEGRVRFEGPLCGARQGKEIERQHAKL